MKIQLEINQKTIEVEEPQARLLDVLRQVASWRELAVANGGGACTVLLMENR